METESSEFIARRGYVIGCARVRRRMPDVAEEPITVSSQYRHVRPVASVEATLAALRQLAIDGPPARAIEFDYGPFDIPMQSFNLLFMKDES